jgi:hypothetical protein
MRNQKQIKQNKKFIKFYKKFQKSYSNELDFSVFLPDDLKHKDNVSHAKKNHTRVMISLLKAVNPFLTRNKHLNKKPNLKASKDNLIGLKKENLAVSAEFEIKNDNIYQVKNFINSNHLTNINNKQKVKLNFQFTSKTIFPKSLMRLFDRHKNQIVGTNIEIFQYALYNTNKNTQLCLNNVALCKTQLSDLVCAIFKKHENSYTAITESNSNGFIVGAFVVNPVNFTGFFISASELSQCMNIHVPPGYQLNNSVVKHLNQVYTRMICVTSVFHKLALTLELIYAKKNDKSLCVVKSGKLGENKNKSTYSI